ncbi:uncharacterized protein LOC131940943 [Physella acuta]|uniref:uncharacterized protein LOC131940943 n=1 Tax=Physella acuta TaxID=109671 RepID=UPI0027DB115E|nr:uncharacterized protein LOC131940943 [Physella acuta]
MIQKYYFCDNAKLNQTICFEKIFNASDFFENPKDIEVELAKVVVLLIAIGAFGDSHEHFISSAVQLPSEMHLDIMAIIQSAIPVDSSQVVLSPQIEQTLRGVTGSKKVYLSVEDTKLKNGKAPVMKNTVPTVRGSNTYEETKPVTLCTQEKPVSSKDLEIRALRQQLNNEICLKEELQFLLQDYKSEVILKDSEIISLRKKLKEVIDMQNSYEDLQEMKQKYNQLELNLDRLNKTVLTLQHYKDYSLVLEKENLSLNEEISKLEKEVKTMQLEINKARDLIKIIDKLENQVKVLESQTENMYRFKQECEEVKVSLREALDVNEMLLQEIHQLKDQDKGGNLNYYHLLLTNVLQPFNVVVPK